MAVGDACTVGTRAKKDGFWYACTATNVWTIVQPTCTENTHYTGGTLNNGGYTFTSTPANGSKIAGDYPSAGTRYCYVYDSTANTWFKKTDADCGTEASGGAWYGCTVTSCTVSGNACSSTAECCTGTDVVCNYDSSVNNVCVEYATCRNNVTYLGTCSVGNEEATGCDGRCVCTWMGGVTFSWVCEAL